MSYQNQLLKQLANGRYTKKPYMDFAKKNDNTNRARRPRKGVVNEEPYTETVNVSIVAPKKSLNQIFSELEPVNEKQVERRAKIPKSRPVDRSQLRGVPEKVKDVLDRVKVETEVAQPMDPMESEHFESMEVEPVDVPQIVPSTVQSPVKPMELNPPNVPSINSLDISSMEKKLTDLENYLVDIAIEIDNLTTSQKKLLSAVNKLPNEINKSKNRYWY